MCLYIQVRSLLRFVKRKLLTGGRRLRSSISSSSTAWCGFRRAPAQTYTMSVRVLHTLYPVRPWKNKMEKQHTHTHWKGEKSQAPSTGMLLCVAPIARLISREDRRRWRRLLKKGPPFASCQPYHTTACCWIKERSCCCCCSSILSGLVFSDWLLAAAVAYF